MPLNSPGFGNQKVRTHVQKEAASGSAEVGAWAAFAQGRPVCLVWGSCCRAMASPAVGRQRDACADGLGPGPKAKDRQAICRYSAVRGGGALGSTAWPQPSPGPGVPGALACPLLQLPQAKS